MLPKSIMIMAGGTGGHVYPALAVAIYLREQGLTVNWLGTDKGLEAQVVPENDFTLLKIRISGIRGKGITKKLSAPLIIGFAILQSLYLFWRVKPAVVLGMGGFASGPGGIAARLLGIPLCIHEQNAVAGFTNKLLLPFAQVVMEAFPGTFKYSTKVHQTGNPVRSDILRVVSSDERQLEDQYKEAVRLLVIGGSLGAKKLNDVVPAAIQQIENKVDFQVQHQTGIKHFDIAKDNYLNTRIKVDVTAYIEDMAAAYAWADIVLCRAGAMTIAELSIVGVASILVPYPYAVDDHQTVNAHYLSDNACAILISETELTEKYLAEVLLDLSQSRTKLKTMANKARALGQPKATEAVAQLCMGVVYA